MPRYTFGDDDPAVQRLALVAAAYEPVSRAFLSAHIPSGADAVADVGCGPGFSTALIHTVAAPKRLIGIDSSAAFLDVARRRVPSATFVVHDATVVPFPGGPYDVIYARLVLAHLPDPLAVAERWRSQVPNHGVVLLEDLEGIDAPAGPLRAYEDISTAVVRAGGGTMYGGAGLAPLGGATTPVTVPAAEAARIYLFNVRRWQHDMPAAAGAAAGIQRSDLDALERDLARIADGPPGHASGSTLSWIVRQIALPGTGYDRPT